MYLPREIYRLVSEYCELFLYHVCEGCMCVFHKRMMFLILVSLIKMKDECDVTPWVRFPPLDHELSRICWDWHVSVRCSHVSHAGSQAAFMCSSPPVVDQWDHDGERGTRRMLKSDRNKRGRLTQSDPLAGVHTPPTCASGASCCVIGYSPPPNTHRPLRMAWKQLMLSPFTAPSQIITDVCCRLESSVSNSFRRVLWKL